MIENWKASKKFHQILEIDWLQDPNIVYFGMNFLSPRNERFMML